MRQQNRGHAQWSMYRINIWSKRSDMGQWKKSATLIYVADRCNTQTMCNKEVRKGPWILKNVTDRFITHEKFDNAIWYPSTIEYVFDMYRT